MLTLTPSQTTTANRIKAALRRREMVCLFGTKPNGKTHTLYHLMSEFSGGIVSRDRSTIVASSNKDYTLDFMEGVDLPTNCERVEVDRVKRQVLHYYGDKSREPHLEMRRRFINLLVELKAAMIMPVISIDTIELIPRRGLKILKLLNQLVHNGEYIGIASLLSGDLTYHRLPENFWVHATEIKIGKILAEEVRQLALQVAPEYKDYFTDSVLKRIGECPSVAEMKKLIRYCIEYWVNYSDQKLIGLDTFRAAQSQMDTNRTKLSDMAVAA